MKILVTGHCGLIGCALHAYLPTLGYDVRGLDVRTCGRFSGDVRRYADVERAIDGVDGVVHLAAISRVVDAQAHPAQAWRTNVGGMHHVIEAAKKSAKHPWVLFASSREVYGQVTGQDPVHEDAVLAPINDYARTKVVCESLLSGSGVPHGILRFSNVYGGRHDHITRVVPAFVAAAISGSSLVVEDGARVFDFVHVEDVVRGVSRAIDKLSSEQALPGPVHLVSGISTSLMQLASLVIEITGSSSAIVEEPGRDFDVIGFYGSPEKAKRVLGWRTSIPLKEGIQSYARQVGSA